MGGIFGKSKLPRSFSSPSSSPSTKNGPTTSSDNSNSGRYMVTPFIFKRWSSMYIDEDGDIAHEFFTEPHRTSSVKGSSRTLSRVDPSLLRPEGYVEYEIPRLHPDIPYIMVEVSCFNAE